MKEWMEEIDFEEKSIIEVFCEHFGLTPRPLNCAMRDALENIWCRKYYFYKHVDASEGIDEFDWEETYDLKYLADQWWGVDLLKWVPDKSKSGAHQVCVFRGEGDTPTEALLELFFEAEELLDDNDREALKDIFSDKIDEWNEQYEVGK